MADTSDMHPLRLCVDGFNGKINDIIYHLPKSLIPKGWIVFFGGDVQDYKENMMRHRDNKQFVKWDLESTCTLLHERFPSHCVLVVKPTKMSLMTFSCYVNFVEVNNFGAPTYAATTDSLKHFSALMQKVETHVKDKCKSILEDEKKSLIDKIDCIPLTLIGFSKGSVVLNQFLYSFSALATDLDQDLASLTNRIEEMYWLEGGHSGSAETWVTNRSVLENFAQLRKTVHIHITPYQVMCDTRPRIGKEEKIFREQLLRMGVKLNRVLHFSDEPRSVEKHFEVLNVFKEPVKS